MWEKIRVIFTIPELRQKVLLTLGLLAIYRVGWQIPLPIVDTEGMTAFFKGGTGGLADLLNQISVFSASQLSQATIFGLGIMPYISASIIFQLLGSVYPPLEKLQKEGESGRKKINEYTRYATVIICIGQSWFYVGFLIQNNLIHDQFLSAGGSLPFTWQLVGVMTMTAGTVFLMWLGEQIDEYGIGNGISLLIMAGILARMFPVLYQDIILPISETGLALGGVRGTIGVEKLFLLTVLFVGVVLGIVLITQGQRRIPTQSAKHVRGRRVYGGTRQYLPLRINQAGVMPIIFASSLLLFPSVIFQYFASHYSSSFWGPLEEAFRRGDSWIYNVTYVVLIYFFCYFWTAISFNPKDMSDNLKNYGTFIPGYRPGRRTADYLEKVMVRITYVGAGFLAVVAIVPTVLSAMAEVPYDLSSFYGGTSLLIAVSVAFDVVQKVDSHLVMRNYKGLLEKG
ncbi:MAG: preprotein translocase subunit SecY [Pirellulales bacterium]|nr:preprotein translocase subunit SecY [Pirellulales bacterium]